VLIDQHAAHERVMLERLGRLLRSEGISTQVLLVPQILELSPARAAVLEDQLHLLARIGFDVAFYGGASFAVRGVPAGLRGLDPLRLAEDLADDLIEGGRGATVEALDRIALSRLACHSAIRAHQALSLYEMRSLLGELDRVDFGVCAHGRPVAVRVSAREIEARFHRT
jgi:DNA mismatch repair protein MutL